MNKVGYNKVIGLIFLPLSLFILIAGLAFGSISAITGILLLVVSIGYLSAPAVTYGEDQIEIKNMVGITVKKYVFGADEISVKEGKVFVNGRKLKIQRGLCVGTEYDLMVDFIADRLSRNGDSDGLGTKRQKNVHPNVQKNEPEDDYLEVF